MEETSKPIDLETYRPAEGRVPGLFIWSWSEVTPADGLDRVEQLDRLHGTMGHGACRFLDETVPGARYVQTWDDQDDVVYHDGGLFVPYDPPTNAKLLALLAPTWYRVVLPACQAADWKHEELGRLGERVMGVRVDPHEDPGGSEAVVDWLDRDHEGPFDFSPEEAESVRFAIDDLYGLAREPFRDKLLEFLDVLVPDPTGMAPAGA